MGSWICYKILNDSILQSSLKLSKNAWYSLWGEKESENTNLLAKLNKTSFVRAIEKFFSNNYIQQIWRVISTGAIYWPNFPHSSLNIKYEV